MTELTRKASAQERIQAVLRSGGARAVTSYIPPETTANRIQNLFKDYAPLGYQLPFEMLEYIELLATYNPDYSQAIENIRTLANSGHEVYVDAKSELQAKRIKDSVEEMARMVQQGHGGIDGVIDKLLDQAATYGCMCGEWVLKEDLTGVVDFVDINPKHIRFFWEDDEQVWAPYQKVKQEQAEQAKRQGQKVLNMNFVKLNTITFRYYAFDAAPSSPYGTPPFLAALFNISIQRDMMENIAQIVKKMSLLGMVDITIESLQPKPGESDGDYTARAIQYLDDYAIAAQDMVKEGGMVHFNDVEVSTTSIGGNTVGAQALFEQNEEQVFSGLKSMPSVQGRSYSTTETYAGVAYDIIIRNTEKYQRMVKRMIEHGYWLHAQLQGLTPQKINLKFNPNRTLNRLRDAQSEALEIENGKLKWLLGLVDQRGFGQELGYASPKTDYERPGDAEADNGQPDATVDPFADNVGGGLSGGSNTDQGR